MAKTDKTRTTLSTLTVMIFIPLFFYTLPNLQPQSSDSPQDDMVLIPGGEFIMGKEEENIDNPAHVVLLDSFFLDKYEVTNSQYLRFCNSTGRALPEFWEMDEFHSGPDYPDHPVVGVSWIDARDYAEWIGKRLPTEAEWEYAARGGLVGKIYPNGDEIDSTTANYTVAGRKKGTVPVGNYPPNGFGLHDMTGNVAEWVYDHYEKDYYLVSPKYNPKGPLQGKFQVIRGGGWHTGPGCSQVYFRNAIRFNWVDFNVGIRCASDTNF